MSSRSMTRKPLTANTAVNNRLGSSLFARNTTSASKNPAQKPGNLSMNRPSLSRPNLLSTAKPKPEADENIEAPQEVEVPAPAADLNQSRHLGELLRSTNNSLAQLKVELTKINDAEPKRVEGGLLGETMRSTYIAPEPVNASLVGYQKDLISELREDNHKLLIADLKLKNGQEQLKQTNGLLTTNNALLKDRLETEKLRLETKDAEISKLNRANAELLARIAALERDSAANSAKEVEAALEVRRKEGLIRAMVEQARAETDARRRHNVELELELARNGKLQNENERLRVEGRHLMEAVEVLKGEIAVLKRSNQEVLEMLRY